MIWWIEQIDWIFVYWEWWISIEATKICYFGLALSGIGSQPTRFSDVLNLKNLKTMRYKVDFLLPVKLQKISYCFVLCRKILLANQFAGFLTFDLFDLLILIPWVHCHIVLVFLGIFRITILLGKYFEKNITIKLYQVKLHHRCFPIFFFSRTVISQNSFDQLHVRKQYLFS